LIAVIAASFFACAKPMVSAHIIENTGTFSEDYAAVPNDIYYAVRWALKERGYAVAEENLAEGIITTTWIPVKSDSHYMPFFGRRDYGVTSSYYQLKVYVVSEGARTRIKVSSSLKTLVSRMESTGIEERKVLASIGDYLRKGAPDLTNLGVNE
jgi:uncharacterized lipoprotein